MRDPKGAPHHLHRIVRASVEETLSALPEAEADRLVGTDSYERCEKRKDYRLGHHDGKLITKLGEVTLKVPKLHSPGLDTAIIESYRRRESSVEEALAIEVADRLRGEDAAMVLDRLGRQRGTPSAIFVDNVLHGEAVATWGQMPRMCDLSHLRESN